MFNNVSKKFVGVDVSKNSLDVYIHPIKKSYQFHNNIDGINELIDKLSKFSTIEKVVCEATGGHETTMIKLLREKEFRVWRINPRQMNAFIKSEGVHAKTDAIDAKYIALFASQKTQNYDLVVLSEDENNLKELSKRRTVLVEIAKQEKTRFQNPSITDFCKESIKKHLKFLEIEIDKIDDSIKTMLTQSTELKQKAKIITSMSGIGNTTAAVLLSELPELGKIENKQIAALIGVVPYPKQSGLYKGKSKVSGGRKVIRHALYMAALSASRFNPQLKIFCATLISAGKKFKVAILAVMRKMICILNAIVKKGELWSPTFHESRVKSAVPAVEALC